MKLTAGGSAPLVILAALGLVSLFGARTQAQAMDTAAVVTGVCALLAALGLMRGSSGRSDVRPPSIAATSRMTWAWGGFLAWALLASALSGRPWAALMGEVTNLQGWFTLAAFALIAWYAARNAGAVQEGLAVAAPVVVFAQVIATLVQLLLATTPRGSLPNSTYLGEAVVLLLPFVLDESPGGRLPLRRLERRAIAVSAVIVLAAAGSRVAAAVALAWLLWALVRDTGISRAARSLAAAGILVATVAGALTFARAEVLGSAGVETLGERPQMWSTAALAVAERPLLGYGADGFVAGGAAVTSSELARSGPVIVFRPGAVDPHNLLVWVAVSAGIVGLVLFAWALVELVLAWRARDGGSAAWGAGGLLVISLTAPLALQVVPLFALVVGVSFSGAGRARDDVVRTAAPAGRGALRLVTAAALGIAALLLTVNAAMRLPLEVHGPEVSPGRTGAAQAATDLWPFDPHLAHLASLHWGWAAAANPSIAASQPDLRAIQRAVAVDSRDPFVALEYARTLRFYGAAPADLERAFLQVFERWELFPLARAEYAVFLAQQGRVDEAREQIAIAELVVDRDPQRLNAIDAAKELLGP